MTPSDTPELLATVHPWASLSPAELQAVAADFVTRTFPAATPVFRVDETLEGLYVIVSGKV